MAIYNKETRLSEILMLHPSLIPVINRLGVALGVGDANIEEICKDRGIDCRFFLSVINTFLDEDYFPVNAKDVFTLEKTIEYLEKTDDYYLNVQLPNIERHFDWLIQRSGKENNLEMLRHFFMEMKNHFSETLISEKSELFPILRDHNHKKVNSSKVEAVNVEVEERLQDLLTFFVAHLKGDYDRNLCMAVVTSVFSLYNDICQNNRIRSRILLPALNDIA